MKHSDFKIGTKYQTCTGQHWRCTDVGKRTILAIEIKPELDPAWFKGPPYAVPEVVFNEKELGRAYRTIKEAIMESVSEKSAHPGFPNDASMIMMRETCNPTYREYPHKELLEIDRVDTDGEILDPYGVKRKGKGWIILCYRLFAGDFKTVAEDDFVQLPRSSESAMRRRRETYNANRLADIVVAKVSAQRKKTTKTITVTRKKR